MRRKVRSNLTPGTLASRTLDSIPARGVLAGTCAEAIARLTHCCRAQTYPAAAVILGVDDPTRFVCFVVDGVARVVLHTPEGRAIAFRELHPGDVFGELAAIDNHPRSASVEAVTPCTLAVMEAGAFISFLADEPAIAHAIMRHLTAQIRRLTSRVYELSALSVTARIRAHLLRLALQAPADKDGTRVVSPPRHEELAGRLATHREAVSREVKFLVENGIVEKGTKGTLIVKDIDALAALVPGAEGRPQ